jgi:hypothetical protein
MTGDNKLRQALAEDKNARAAADRRAQAQKEAVKREEEMRNDAQAKFNGLKILMQAAIDRIEPMLRENELSVKRPSVTVSGALDRVAYSVYRGTKAVASVSVVLRYDGSVQIGGAEEGFRYDDARLTQDFFFEEFADTIANGIKASHK